MSNMDLNNMLMNTNLYTSASDVNISLVNKNSINISKLRNDVQHREERKYKTFEKVLEMCYQKILSTNKTNTECCCTFICPHVIFGLPLFNIIECIHFIMEKLLDKGFEVHLVLQTHIIISWQHNSEKKAQHIKSYYQLAKQQQQQQLQLEYTPFVNNNTNNINNNINNANNNNTNNNKLKQSHQTSQQYNKPETQFRPIEDYTQANTNNIIYNNNDIDIFRNKIDELLI